jgi:hypothetical protein
MCVPGGGKSRLFPAGIGTPSVVLGLDSFQGCDHWCFDGEAHDYMRLPEVVRGTSLTPTRVPWTIKPHVVIEAVTLDDRVGFEAEDTSTANADHHVFGAMLRQTQEAERTRCAVCFALDLDLLSVLGPVSLLLLLSLVVGEQVSGLFLCGL